MRFSSVCATVSKIDNIAFGAKETSLATLDDQEEEEKEEETQ